MAKKIILLTLQTFSAMGGIQKMARTMAHSLQHISNINHWKFKALSLYDTNHDLLPQYIDAENFKGYKQNRLRFIFEALTLTRNNDVLILTHINFAVIGLLAKLIRPKCQLWLVAHGIEVWRPLKYNKKKLLRHCDKILCVSQFTLDKMVELHNAEPGKLVVLNNAIDSFMKIPDSFEKPKHLLSRYHLSAHAPVVFTLTRLASTEKYKGYENVIAAISKLKLQFPDIKYILSGKYDRAEETRVRSLIAKHNVNANVLLTGFVDEAELGDHFLLADLFVLPSKKEGFGIVFVEAQACGLPVLCGNADGSVDAVRNGELGKAIEPDDIEALEEAIAASLQHPLSVSQRKALQQKSLHYFSEEAYITNLQKLLADEITVSATHING
ncbi:glycosyltransferase family 4 protein [Mucilaginibacter pedocola]|uniref:Glycosyl transferase family 1 domain-containing protein n=1 Tax=Mucilaginibacter pedocola TaxID=1792845 RepID=A0A1S9PAT4_9SPHI|nr:glycosyltransferase family 4 protein [Mucilaginibacter pedocola]OOQ58065.1 hypothetical protein BC343_10415 [Mucilaginibacter pedocola]